MQGKASLALQPFNLIVKEHRDCIIQEMQAIPLLAKASSTLA
jgi:hypothetical protein